jgi:metal-dependent amidase/aminoacylase/carboxypeptidase family protein
MLQPRSSKPSLEGLVEESHGELFTFMQTIRRTLHANPELSFEEYETCLLVERELAKIQGVQNIRRVTATGVVASIFGTATQIPSPTPVVLIREVKKKIFPQYKIIKYKT